MILNDPSDMTLNNKETNSSNMHELFMQVLKNRDLSRAGDLFSVPDSEIVNNLTSVVSPLIYITILHNG